VDHPCCLICLDKFKVGEKIRCLPCNHRYHATCVDKWLKTSSPCCPSCRYDCRQAM
ncbi:hypothetical protein GQ42DRAFT_114641, partial [Ramicandelaber brevisporus]